MKVRVRTTMVAVGAVVVIVASAPMIAYWSGLAMLPGYPVKPEPLESVGARELAVWGEYSGHAMLGVRPVNPYEFAILLSCAPIDACLAQHPGLAVASHVAQAYLRGQPPTRAAWWHLQSAALSVWLTRHWTAEQLLAYLVRSDRGLSSNHGSQPPVGAPSIRALCPIRTLRAACG